MSHSRSTGTNLGIKTPLLHNTSNPPKRLRSQYVLQWLRPRSLKARAVEVLRPCCVYLAGGCEGYFAVGYGVLAQPAQLVKREAEFATGA